VFGEAFCFLGVAKVLFSLDGEAFAESLEARCDGDAMTDVDV
jgi:hypothetical protein